MKLLLDTSTTELMMLLIKNNKVVDSVFLNEQKKSDILPKIYQKLLENNDILTENITEFYVTKGPGSFMGARVGLTFLRTIAQITHAKFFVIDTLKLYSKGKEFFLDAKSGKSFFYDPQTNLTTLISFHANTLIDKKYIINNIKNILTLFDEINPKDAKPNYIKEPNVGRIK